MITITLPPATTMLLCSAISLLIIATGATLYAYVRGRWVVMLPIILAGFFFGGVMLLVVLSLPCTTFQMIQISKDQPSVEFCQYAISRGY